MYRLTEIRYQEYAVEPLFIGKIPQSLIGISKNQSQFRVVIFSGIRNSKL